MAEFPDELCVRGKQVEVVDRDVSVKMPGWVEALPLDTRDTAVFGLATDELASLVDVCCVVRPISTERHPEGRNHKNNVHHAHETDH